MQEGSLLLAKIGRLTRGLITSIATALGTRCCRAADVTCCLGDYGKRVRALLTRHREFLRRPPTAEWGHLRDLLLDLSGELERAFLSWFGTVDTGCWPAVAADLRALQGSGERVHAEAMALQSTY